MEITARTHVSFAIVMIVMMSCIVIITFFNQKHVYISPFFLAVAAAEVVGALVALLRFDDDGVVL